MSQSTSVPRHGFLYALSRAGKTTFAKQWAIGLKAPLLVVTCEPNVSRASLNGCDYQVFAPRSSEELFLFLDYTNPFLDKHHGGLRPGLVLFDNLQGLQRLVVGEPAEKGREVMGVKIPDKPASGLMRFPMSDRSSAEGAMGQMDYGMLGRQTRRLLNCIDQMETNTLVTAVATLGFDEKYQQSVKGLSQQTAAGRAATRVVQGWPSTEGQMTKLALPSLISGFFLHLEKDEKANYWINTKTHVDADQIEWFADSRGLSSLEAKINWTNRSVWDTLRLGG